MAAGALLAVFSFVLTGGTIALLAHGLLGLPGPSAVALGSLLGVPSSAVVLPVLAPLGLGEELRTRLVLDAAMADVLGILGVEIAIGAMGGASVPSLVLRSTVVGFAVGAAVAVGAGLVWSRYLRWASGTGGLRLGEALAFAGICVLGRRAAVVAVNRVGLLPLGTGETNDVAALFPRGLVTAVLAFEAMGAGLPGSETFTLFAFVVLVATNLAMVFSFQATRRGPAPATVDASVA